MYMIAYAKPIRMLSYVWQGLAPVIKWMTKETA